jgi:hypothetical protein
MQNFKILLFLIFSVSISVNAQENFKGKIIYELEFEIYNSDISRELLINAFGTGATFLYEDGKYFQTYVKGLTEFDFMDAKSGKYYRKESNNDTIFLSDPTKRTNYSLIDTEEGESNQIVLGYKCNYFKINANIDSINQKHFLKFFFTDEILIDGSLFQNIEKGFANITYGKMNSIPIKFEIGDDSFKMIATATSIDKNYNFDLDKKIQEKLDKYPSKMEQF